MTLQEVFDKVAAALMAQDGPSVDDLGMCLYRGPGGRRCAVGHLIEDEDYSKRLEGGLSYFRLKNPGLWRKLQLDEEDMYLLVSQLQGIHDDYSGCINCATWRRLMCSNLTDAANRFGLSAAVLKKSADAV